MSSTENGPNRPPTTGGGPGGADPGAAPEIEETADTVAGQPIYLSRNRALRRVGTSSPFYMGGVLIVLIIVFSAIKPDAFPTANNARNIVLDASTLLVMATAMTYVMVAAGFDLSIGSVLVFANVIAAEVMSGLGTDNVFTVLIGLVAAMSAGGVWGVFNGFCVTRLRVPALITTLGTLGAALGVADLITNGNDVRNVPLTLINLGVDTFLGLSYLVWVAIVVAIIGGLVLHLTRYGRHTFLVGSNTEAARRAGINVDRHLIGLYALTGLAAGLAGMMSLTQFATTTIAGHTTDVISVITGVVLGGTSLFGGIGTVAGTTIGILIPATLNNGFIIVGVRPFWQQVATGLILILAVYLDQLKRRSRERV